MADGLKEYPPSDLKLARLRNAGIVPISKEVFSFAMLLALPFAVAGIWLLADRLLVDWSAELFSAVYQETADPGAGEQLTEEVLASVRLVLIFSGLGLGCLCGVVLLFGALQNRFLWTMAPLGFQLNRVFSPGVYSFSEIASRVVVALARLLLLLLLLGAGVLLIRYLVLEWNRDLLYPQLQQPLAWQTAAKKSAALLFQSTLLFALAALFIAVISRLLVVTGFRRSQRMTRAEVEAEAKEMEAAPEFRSARRGLLDS